MSANERPETSRRRHLHDVALGRTDVGDHARMRKARHRRQQVHHGRDRHREQHQVSAIEIRQLCNGLMDDALASRRGGWRVSIETNDGDVRPRSPGRECDRSANQTKTDNADARKWRVRVRHVREILLPP